MPDVDSSSSWLPPIADAWGSVESPPHVTTLSHHYYFGGPPSNPDVTSPTCSIRNHGQGPEHGRYSDSVRQADGHSRSNDGRQHLLSRRQARRLRRFRCRSLGSRLFAAARRQQLFRINLHGGTGQIIASGLGGFMFGDEVLKDSGATPEQIATIPHPYYAPIAPFGSDCVLEPVAYGLKFAGSFSGGAFIQADLSSQLQAAGINATAYAARLASGQTSVIVLNKDMENDLVLRLDFGAAKSGVLEDRDAAWHHPSRAGKLHITRAANSGQLKSGKFTARVPRASGLRLTVG